MWLVKLGLRRPYTLAVVAILLGVLGGLTIQRTSTDVLPDIDIPVVSAIWHSSPWDPVQFAAQQWLRHAK